MVLDRARIALTWVPPNEHLLNGQATSVHWRSAFVSKEPICCSVNVGISVVCQVVCHVLMHCLGSFILHDICFRGAKLENKNFSVKCCLLAFNIVAVGPVVSYHIYQRPVFFKDAVALLRLGKATRFCREVLMFLPSVWLSLCFSSLMNKFVAPFVPSGTT